MPMNYQRYKTIEVAQDVTKEVWAQTKQNMWFSIVGMILTPQHIRINCHVVLYVLIIQLFNKKTFIFINYEYKLNNIEEIFIMIDCKIFESNSYFDSFKIISLQIPWNKYSI